MVERLVPVNARLPRVWDSREGSEKFRDLHAAFSLTPESLLLLLSVPHILVTAFREDTQGGDGEGKMHPDSIAREYFHLAEQTSDCWSFQHHIQCKTSDMSLL